jgi:hypothetical protein
MQPAGLALHEFFDGLIFGEDLVGAYCSHING